MMKDKFKVVKDDVGRICVLQCVDELDKNYWVNIGRVIEGWIYEL